MINDLNASEADMWKYVDDTTISEVVRKGPRELYPSSSRRSCKTGKG